MDKPATGRSLPKSERLCGRNNIASLFEKGKWGSCGHLRYRWVRNEGGGQNRLLVSVPKKFFKRAVKRNLLKRRIRESYRLQKELLTVGGVDFAVSYASPEIADFDVIRAEVAELLRKIDSAASK